MVEWASGGYVRTFDQSAANGKKEPNLSFFPCRSEWLLLWKGCDWPIELMVLWRLGFEPCEFYWCMRSPVQVKFI